MLMPCRWISRHLIPGDNFQAVGPQDANGTAQEYFNARKVSIYAGSNEIQRNIMSKLVLGLVTKTPLPMISALRRADSLQKSHRPFTTIVRCCGSDMGYFT